MMQVKTQDCIRSVEVNGLKFNLSKKPIPVTRVFLGYVFKFNPKPKLEGTTLVNQTGG